MKNTQWKTIVKKKKMKNTKNNMKNKDKKKTKTMSIKNKMTNKKKDMTDLMTTTQYMNNKKTITLKDDRVRGRRKRKIMRGRRITRRR